MFSVDHIERKYLRDMFTKNNIKYLTKGYTIIIDNIEILFTCMEQDKQGTFAGLHPDPLRFVDHHVQEVFIAMELQKIKNRLKEYCKGHITI